MSRFVQPRGPGAESLEPGAPAEGGATAGDGYAARVAKYVPAEIVAAYVAILAVLDPASATPAGGAGTGTGTTHALCLASFLVLLVATPAYLWLVGKPGDRPPAVQLVLSTAAFAVWAYALRGLSCAFPAVAFDGKVAFVALVLFTVVSGLFRPGDHPPGPPRVPPVSAAPPG